MRRLRQTNVRCWRQPVECSASPALRRAAQSVEPRRAAAELLRVGLQVRLRRVALVAKPPPPVVEAEELSS